MRPGWIKADLTRYRMYSFDTGDVGLVIITVNDVHANNQHHPIKNELRVIIFGILCLIAFDLVYFVSHFQSLQSNDM